MVTSFNLSLGAPKSLCTTGLASIGAACGGSLIQGLHSVLLYNILACRKPQKTMKGQPKINEISDPLILERYVAIADYEKQKKNECSVAAGQTVEVIDKNENGMQAPWICMRVIDMVVMDMAEFAD